MELLWPGRWDVQLGNRLSLVPLTMNPFSGGGLVSMAVKCSSHRGWNERQTHPHLECVFWHLSQRC